MRQINEVMREWAMADNQSKNLPKADRQALNEHFQSILQTLEEQVSGERQRLVETHATRVIALINDQRRAALEGFLAALQGDPPQAERVLLALRRYLRAEQKEQRHTLRHYQHVAAVDPEKAQQMRFQVQTHLQVIEERMNQSLGLLDQNPHLAQELRPQIQELLHSEHLNPNELEAPAPAGSSEDKGGLQPLDSKDDTPMALPKGSTEQDAASSGKEKMSPLEQYERKVNVSVPRGFPFHSSEIQRDELEEALWGYQPWSGGGGPNADPGGAAAAGTAASWLREPHLPLPGGTTLNQPPLPPLAEPRPSHFLEPQNPNSQPCGGPQKCSFRTLFEGAGSSYFPFPIPNSIPKKSPDIPSCLPAWDSLTLIYFVS